MINAKRKNILRSVAGGTELAASLGLANKRIQ